MNQGKRVREKTKKNIHTKKTTANPGTAISQPSPKEQGDSKTLRNNIYTFKCLCEGTLALRKQTLLWNIVLYEAP